jgi:hypothetical protein
VKPAEFNRVQHTGRFVTDLRDLSTGLGAVSEAASAIARTPP